MKKIDERSDYGHIHRFDESTTKRFWESHSVSNYRQKIKKIEYWMKNYTKVSLHTLNIVHNKYINIFYIKKKKRNVPSLQYVYITHYNAFVFKWPVLNVTCYHIFKDEPEWLIKTNEHTLSITAFLFLSVTVWSALWQERIYFLSIFIDLPPNNMKTSPHFHLSLKEIILQASSQPLFRQYFLKWSLEGKYDIAGLQTCRKESHEPLYTVTSANRDCIKYCIIAFN